MADLVGILNANDDRQIVFCGSRVSRDEGQKSFDMSTGEQEERSMQFVAPGLLVQLVAWYLLLNLAACGAPVSEKAPGPVPNTSKGLTAGGGGVTGTVQRGSDQNDRKAVSSTQPVAETDERNNRSIPGVPDTVVKELGSADPRDRYRALDHWEKKDSNASLDPVF